MRFVFAAAVAVSVLASSAASYAQYPQTSRPQPVRPVGPDGKPLRGAEAALQIQAGRISDMDCALAFYVGAAGDAAVRGDLSQKLEVAAGKVLASKPGATQAQVKADIERQGKAMAARYQSSPSGVAVLLKQVNTCETKYGMALT